METVGVRELKEQTSRIVRRVREGHRPIAVTYRGKVVAHLVPVEHQESGPSTDFARVWSDMDRLAAEISARWPEGLSAADAVSEDRREL